MTYCHLHMVSPSVVLLVDDFKKVPSLSRQPVKGHIKKYSILVTSDRT